MKKLNQVLRVVVVSAVLAWPGGTALAQATLDVLYNNNTGQPLKKVEVFLQSLQTRRLETVASNRKGRARFKKLPAGYYRLWARTKGYRPLYREFLNLKEGSTESVTLGFEPGDSAQLLYFEDSESLQKSKELYAQGVQAMRQQKMDQAEEKLKESRQLNPSNPEALQGLGMVQLRRKSWDEARESFEAAVELLAMFGTLGTAEERSHVEQLRQSLQQLLGEIPVMQLEQRAEQAFQAKEYWQAVESYQELIEVNPENGGYHYNLALAYLRSDRIDEARRSADRALELDPDDVNTHKLGDLIDDYLLNAEAAKVRERLEEIRQLHQDGKAEEALAIAEAQLGEFSEEIEAVFRVEIARAHVKLEHSEPAIENFRKAVSLHPEQLGIERELAEVYVQAERYAEAAETFRSFYERSGEDPDESLFKLAAESVRMGNKQWSTVIYENILVANPDFAEAYFQLGMQRYFETQYDEAKRLLGHYQEIGSDPSNLQNVEAVMVVISRARR